MIVLVVFAWWFLLGGLIMDMNAAICLVSALAVWVAFGFLVWLRLDIRGLAKHLERHDQEKLKVLRKELDFAEAEVARLQKVEGELEERIELIQKDARDQVGFATAGYEAVKGKLDRYRAAIDASLGGVHRKGQSYTRVHCGAIDDLQQLLADVAAEHVLYVGKIDGALGGIYSHLQSGEAVDVHCHAIGELTGLLRDLSEDCGGEMPAYVARILGIGLKHKDEACDTATAPQEG